MKFVCISTICILMIFSSNAQKFTIIDKNTLQPVEDVSVHKKTNNSLICISGLNGQIEMPEGQLDDILIFTHPSYSEKSISYKNLPRLNGVISLQENVHSLDEIIISAYKFAEKRKTVPQKIRLIRSSEMREINQTSTADVLAATGNVMVQKSQLGGGSPIIRGFEANKVLIVIDGIRMNNAIYRGGHLQNVITLDNSIMDRAEVVFGPGSVVYGSDALGGVMSFTTKNPALSSDGKFKAKTSQYIRYQSAVSGFAAHADISLSKKHFGSLTSITFSDFGDLRQGANRKKSVGNFGSRSWYVSRINGADQIINNKDSNLQVGSAYSQMDLLQKFLFRQNNHVKHLINIQYSTSSNVHRYDRLVQLAGGLPRFAEWYYGPQNRFLGSYTIESDKKNLFFDNAKLILGYQQIEESRVDRRFNNTGLNNRIESLDIFSLNADLTKNIGKHKLHYGLEGWYNKVNSRAFTEDIVTGRIATLDTRYASGGAYMQSFAAYLTHTYEISDKLVLNDGLRYSAVKLNAKFTDTTFFRFPFREATQINGAFTGNLGIVYLPGADFRLTALISTGFRAPNVDDVSKVFESVPGTINVPNPGLKPEYTINSEVGISKKIFNKITVEATGYYTMYWNALTKGDFKYGGKDSILYEGVKSKVVSTTNAGRAYLYGMELGMHGQLNDNVSVYGTYNFTYGRIVSTPTIIPLDHIPPVFGKLGTEIKYRKFNYEFFVHYSGWKRIKDYNPFGEDNQAYALPEGMPSWYTLNARLTCQFNKIFNLQLACENILDKNYRVFASNISAPGRNFIATLRCDF